MKSGAMLALAALALLAVPSGAAILYRAAPAASLQKTGLIDVWVHGKLQDRVPADDTAEPDAVQPLIELAQAFGLPWEMSPPIGGPPPQSGPGMRGPMGPMLPPPPRAACEDEVDRLIGLTAYLKSKMRLKPDQKIAWEKIEQVAAPGLGKMRDLCAQLPAQVSEPPAITDAIGFVEKQLTAKAELLRAIREPAESLYEMMSGEQRELLRFLVPPPGPAPPPIMPLSPAHGERL